MAAETTKESDYTVVLQEPRNRYDKLAVTIYKDGVIDCALIFKFQIKEEGMSLSANVHLIAI